MTLASCGNVNKTFYSFYDKWEETGIKTNFYALIALKSLDVE